MNSIVRTARIGAAVFVLSVSAPAWAQYRIGEQATQYDATRSAAKRWEATYLALSAVDLAQTVYCLERGKCKEANPLFGKRPSTTKLVLAKVVGGGLHLALFNRMLDRDPNAALRAAQVSVALQGTVVGLNMRVAFR